MSQNEYTCDSCGVEQTGQPAQRQHEHGGAVVLLVCPDCAAECPECDNPFGNPLYCDHCEDKSARTEPTA